MADCLVKGIFLLLGVAWWSRMSVNVGSPLLGPSSAADVAAVRRLATWSTAAARFGAEGDDGTGDRIWRVRNCLETQIARQVNS